MKFLKITGWVALGLLGMVTFLILHYSDLIPQWVYVFAFFGGFGGYMLMQIERFFKERFNIIQDQLSRIEAILRNSQR